MTILKWKELPFVVAKAEMLERLLENERIIPRGGIVVNPPCTLEKITNIYLRVDFETLYSRIQNDKSYALFLNHTKEEFRNFGV